MSLDYPPQTIIQPLRKLDNRLKQAIRSVGVTRTCLNHFNFFIFSTSLMFEPLEEVTFTGPHKMLPPYSTNNT